MRYKNIELLELEDKINRAEREALRLELEIFDHLVEVLLFFILITIFYYFYPFLLFIFLQQVF
jgi:hypothetical protein